MYLTKIYSEPAGLFPSVAFKDGVNFVFGKKDGNEPKQSLNSIGKSTFLDLIDFCLLSSYQSNHNPRLFAAKKIMSGYKIVLEFELNRKDYRIKRAVEDSIIEFGTGMELAKYSVEDARAKLSEMVFGNPSYKGKFEAKWFRSLLGIFVKIQKPKRERFSDPIHYFKEESIAQLMVYHLFLLGIDNSLAAANSEVVKSLKNLKPATEEVQRLAREKYSLDNIKDADNEVNKLRSEIKKLEEAVNVFKLGVEYADAESDANKLTAQIKDLWYSNFADRKKVETYELSFKQEPEASATKVGNIYKQVNEELGIKIKRVLEDAIKFRRALSQSRKAFLANEINKLRDGIKEREEKISQLEDERARLFKILSAKEAISDLTEAFYNVSEKKNKLMELESSLRTLRDLRASKYDLDARRLEIEKKAIKFKDEIKDQEAYFYDVFTRVHNAIYPEQKGASAFSINTSDGRDAVIEINVSFPDEAGKGKNQGRTLIYDLALLIHAIEKGINCPRFLIHDGIFDGMDKAQFAAIVEYLNKLKDKGLRFQYITTINEEGDLTSKFGKTDKVSSEAIEKDAILILRPSQKLFGQDFKT